MKTLKIGNLNLKNPLILSPMVDVTDLSYRLLCRKYGAALAFTEMLYVDAVLHENKKTVDLMKTSKDDKPVGLQITGNNIEEFENFVKSKTWKKFDIIDLNCGCPSIKITGSKAGSYLLNNPEKIFKIIQVLNKTKKTITAKIRLGFKKINVLEVAKEIEKAGAKALTVHARLAIHGRDVPADWSWIKKVKESVKIPIIGNGDVFSPIDAKKMFEETKCDGIMIGRGAIGDPYIFKRILNYLRNNEKEDFDYKKNIKIFKEYLKLQKRYYGKDFDLSRIKYLGSKFLRGFKGSSKARYDLMNLKSFDEIEKFAERIEKSI